MSCRKTIISKKSIPFTKDSPIYKISTTTCKPKVSCSQQLEVRYYDISSLQSPHIFVKLQKLSRLVLKQELSLDYLQTCYTTKQFYFYLSIIYLLYIIFLLYNYIILLSKLAMKYILHCHV